MQEDDYGCETVSFEKSSATASATTGAAASAGAKGVVEKIPEPVSVSAPVKGATDTLAKVEKKAASADEESDEEDMYSQAKSTKKVNDAKAIQESMANLVVDKRFMPKDCYAMFLGTDFLYLDFTNDTWTLGDVVSEQGDLNPVFLIPENTAIVRLDDKEPNCKHTNFIVVGGCLQDGNLVDWHFGVSVIKENERMMLDVGYSIQSLNLPFPRMMHQACLVKNSSGEWRMLVIGGKTGKHQASASYTNTVLALDMKYVLSPWLAEKQGAQMPSWTTVAPMASARANFAHIVIGNLVYVYGGISGNGKGDEQHFPTLASPAIEMYDPAADKWSTVDIDGTPELAAFAWTSMGRDSGAIMVLGGTDGSIIQESQFLIDFSKNTCTEKMEHEFEQQFAMNKLVFNQKQNKFYSFGGYGSGGQNFELKNNDGAKWSESARSHSTILAVKQAEQPDHNILELVNYTGLHFD